MVRQRKSIFLMLCTVCGEPTPPRDRWWFGLGAVQEGHFMTTEAPVHRRCAEVALEKCPHLNKIGGERLLMKFPGGNVVMQSIIGGPATDNDYGVRIAGRRVVGHLKIAWPQREIPRLGIIGVSVTPGGRP
jgi:hypothetical protein